MARERGVESRLHLLGHRDDVEQVISALDVFCLPSLGEGLPRVVMEAQAADIPIVASDVGSVAQIVDPATGRMVKANDAPALAAAIAASLASPPVPGACRAFAEARFSIARMVEKYDNTAAG
jgi:glycosyltransferase involved in cell wall biosynthesis